jgi:hypothetical protein
MKIRPVEAKLFRADMTKLIVVFYNFANAPKYYYLVCLHNNKSNCCPYLSVCIYTAIEQ